jgi:regulator of protease activity HflC (stomatin/prohibitin superfamily)
MTGFDIFAIALVLLVIFTLFAGIKTVPQGYDWTIERFGKYTRTLAPGLNIIVPYFDRVGRKMVFHFIADKYIKAFGQLADSPNQKIVMLPIEAVNVLGSLAGIGEIARATFGESAASAAAAARRASVPQAGPNPPPAPPQRQS